MRDRSGVEVTGRDECQGDDAHGLLRVAGAVGQREERRGGDLAVAESVVLLVVGERGGDL